MGRRTLEISVDLIVSLLKGLGDGQPRYFSVTKDPIPDDFRIVSVCNSPYRPDTVTVIMESEEWDDDPNHVAVSPECKTSFLSPENVKGIGKNPILFVMTLPPYCSEGEIDSIQRNWEGLWEDGKVPAPLAIVPYGSTLTAVLDPRNNSVPPVVGDGQVLFGKIGELHGKNLSWLDELIGG